MQCYHAHSTIIMLQCHALISWSTRKAPSHILLAVPCVESILVNHCYHHAAAAHYWSVLVQWLALYELITIYLSMHDIQELL